MAEYLEYHIFEPLVGKTVTFKGTKYAMSLTNVTKSEKFVATAKRDPFILVFRAPRGPEFMPEGYYECEFENGPTYPIYVAPTHTPDAEWQDYQAIFN